MSAEQRDPESSTVLYKILAPEEAESLPSRSWTGTALDLQDGFLHLSTSDQLAGTLGRFFSKDAFAGDVLFLLRLPRAAIRTDQKLQFDLAHGIKFGHVYSVCRDRSSRRVPLWSSLAAQPIDPDQQFDEKIEIKRDSSGQWVLPSLTF
jgi:uncharacterized protein (DUF952 family)